jgi:hypothetical protein
VTTYTFAGQFNGVGTGGDVNGAPAELLSTSGPASFSFTFSTSDVAFGGPRYGGSTLQIGGLSLSSSYDSFVYSWLRYPAFLFVHEESIGGWGDDIVYWLSISHPVDALYRTTPFGPAQDEFIIDQALLDSTYPSPLEWSFHIDVLHHSTGHNGEISLGNLTLSTIQVDGPPIVLWIPEPSTWTLAILGFGAVGVFLRRGRLTARITN